MLVFTNRTTICVVGTGLKEPVVARVPELLTAKFDNGFTDTIQDDYSWLEIPFAYNTTNSTGRWYLRFTSWPGGHGN